MSVTIRYDAGPMNTLIAAIDQLEREAERVLAALDPAGPDHESVALLLVDLRETREQLRTARESTRSMIETSVEQMSSAQRVLDEVLGADGAPNALWEGKPA